LGYKQKDFFFNVRSAVNYDSTQALINLLIIRTIKKLCFDTTVDARWKKFEAKEKRKEKARKKMPKKKKKMLKKGKNKG
jgi:hypothetical protein